MPSRSPSSAPGPSSARSSAGRASCCNCRTSNMTARNCAIMPVSMLATSTSSPDRRARELRTASRVRDARGSMVGTMRPKAMHRAIACTAYQVATCEYTEVQQDVQYRCVRGCDADFHPKQQQQKVKCLYIKMYIVARATATRRRSDGFLPRSPYTSFNGGSHRSTTRSERDGYSGNMRRQ